MKVRNGFVSNSSSSSFIIEDIFSKGELTMGILDNHIHSYEGFEGDVYNKEDVLKSIKANFKKISKKEVIEIIEDYDQHRESNCDPLFKEGLGKDHYKPDYYFGSYGDDFREDSDYEHCILPHIASACMSHH